jgi:L-aspartate semialdehyde sulfurtransferase ferredoxin
VQQRGGLKVGKRTLMLVFPRECVGEPVISSLVKSFGVEVNILRARIDASEEGRMMAQLSGDDDTIRGSLAYLADRMVEVRIPESSFIWRENLCVHCGACAGLCPSGAFSMNEMTMEVEFDMRDCILCELCIQVCYYGAIQQVEDFIRTGGLQ